MKEEIFSIQLNQEGINWLNRFYKIAKVLFLLSLLISLAGMFNVVLKFYDINYDPANIKDPLYRQQVLVSRAYVLLFYLLFPIQVYFFYRFSKQNEKSIELMDSSKFNASFRLLVINSIISIVTFSLNLIFVVLINYGDWLIYRKYN
ncbi:MAG: hypothetical protein ACJ749_15490 [Flavisolibacter sp.]